MNLTHGLRRLAQINRNGVATGFEGRRRTWGEVAARVARAASGLRELGAAEGERVAILSLNSDLYLEAYLAAAWAGSVIVPLNVRWSAIENHDALEDCRAKVLIVDREFSGVVGQALKMTKVKPLVIDYDDQHYPADAPFPKGERIGTLDYEEFVA